MAIHIINLPDTQHGGDLRSIVWDDVAGTVNGEHASISFFRQTFAAEKPVTVGDTGSTWNLHNPAHDPAEFLVLLWVAFWAIMDGDHRHLLPPVFDGVEFLEPEPREEMYETDPVTGNHTLLK